MDKANTSLEMINLLPQKSYAAFFDAYKNISADDRESYCRGAGDEGVIRNSKNNVVVELPYFVAESQFRKYTYGMAVDVPTLMSFCKICGISLDEFLKRAEGGVKTKHAHLHDAEKSADESEGVKKFLQSIFGDSGHSYVYDTEKYRDYWVNSIFYDKDAEDDNAGLNATKPIKLKQACYCLFHLI